MKTTVSRLFMIVAALAALCLTLTSCMTPQERSGKNPKAFNSPAEWETRPYGANQFRN